jgi:hypothetical protein
MPVVRAPRRAFTLIGLLAALTAAQDGAPQSVAAETFNFHVEWRLIHAGDVRLTLNHPTGAEITVRSAGLLNTLYKVNDRYLATFDPGYCTTSTHLEAQEGRRRRDTKIVIDREKKLSSYLEKDLVKNTVVLSKELEVPSCVHDAASGIQKLRELNLEPGKTAEIPFTDGKKVVMAKVEALNREKVRTPAGEFPCVKYEAFLFNGVVYSRKGRLFLWLSDDNRRLPVQFKVQLPFYVGTITMQLDKK